MPHHHFLTLAFALFAPIVLVVAGCGTSGAETTQRRERPTFTPPGAETTLKQIALDKSDVGGDYSEDGATLQTNDEAASARPDTDGARQQYIDWTQVLSYHLQFNAAPDKDLVFSAKTARILHAVTLYNTTDGAAAAFSYFRGLSDAVVANFLVNDGGGTKISDVQVVKDIAFPAKGDESFAWRISGKATFDNGFVINFVADSVFVRNGRITGTVTTAALGQAPERAELERLVDRFVEKMSAVS